MKQKLNQMQRGILADNGWYVLVNIVLCVLLVISTDHPILDGVVRLLTILPLFAIELAIFIFCKEERNHAENKKVVRNICLSALLLFATLFRLFQSL